MKPEHALVGLGLLALVAGVISFFSISTRFDHTETVASTTVTTSTIVLADGWSGVDGSIQRVLTELGLASVDRDGHLEGVPDEVTRVLAGLDRPLVTHQRENR